MSEEDENDNKFSGAIITVVIYIGLISMTFSYASDIVKHLNRIATSVEKMEKCK